MHLKNGPESGRLPHYADTVADSDSVFEQTPYGCYHDGHTPQSCTWAGEIFAVAGGAWLSYQKIVSKENGPYFGAFK